MIISKTCNSCRQDRCFEVIDEDYQRWENGGLAQNCFPYLDEDQRELLISGTCGPCFDRMFPEDD